MEKYAVQDDDLLSGLRNEEHQLMVEISTHMSGYKTAADDAKFQQSQSRLQTVRDKITSLDLAKRGAPYGE